MTVQAPCNHSGALAILAAGADINGVDKELATPLYVAAEHGDDMMLAYLLGAGADPNKKNARYFSVFVLDGWRLER